MKKIYFLYLSALFLFFSCDNRFDVNVFSALKNTDNITVLEAIASGDEEIMTAVYKREKARLTSLDPEDDNDDFIQTSRNIASLQSVRSRGVILFLALIAIEVDHAEIIEIIQQLVIEDYLYEVIYRVRDIHNYEGDSTGTQKFMAILGILVYWYSITDALGTSPKELIEAFRAGELYTLLENLDWDNFHIYNTSHELENDLASDLFEIDGYIDGIENDPDYENTPELEQAVNNVNGSFGV